MTWHTLPLTLRWGAYFKPTVEEEQKLVDMVSAAKDAGVITLRTAVQRLARQFDIDNVDQYLASLEDEAKEDHATLEGATQMLAKKGAMPKPPPGTPPAEE